MKKYISPLFLLFISILVVSCSSTEKTVVKEQTPVDEQPTQANQKESLSTELSIDLEAYRNELDSPNKNLTNVVDAFYLVSKQGETHNYALQNRGFRVQLLSTRDMALADSVKYAFRAWMDNLNITYKAEAYVVYKQPFYRVRVGDFKNRKLALDYNQFLKRKYPDAWTVSDEIDLKAIPETMDVIKPAVTDSAGNAKAAKDGFYYLEDNNNRK